MILDRTESQEDKPVVPIMAQNPRAVYPQILSFIRNCFRKTFHTPNIIRCYCLTFCWKCHVMSSSLWSMGTLNIAFFYDWKLCVFIDLDIHIRLMTGSLVILINPYFFSSNGLFDDYGIGFSHENCVMSQKFNTNLQLVAANAVSFLKLKKIKTRKHVHR